MLKYLASYCASILALASPLQAMEPLSVAIRASGPFKTLDLRPFMNLSSFDDGIAGNGAGGWTDEGNNDFQVWPELEFGAKLHRGYFFDFVDPASNAGKNLLVTGTADCWPDLPRTLELSFAPVTSRFLFLLHSEGRINGTPVIGGTFAITYADGTSVAFPLRLSKELSNWWQGPWWGNYEELLPDAPAVLRDVGFNRKAYEAAGGSDFDAAVLRHAQAIRWPVIRGMNVFSANWSMSAVFWGLRWENPHPEKPVVSIRLESAGNMLIALAAVTFSDKDFSLVRQTLGALAPPAPPPLDFLDRTKARHRDVLLPGWLELPWTRGMMSVQLRSDRIVTVRLDTLADFLSLYETSCYSVVSATDPAFREPVHPIRISRFSRASNYEEPEVFVDHYMHLELPVPLSPGHRYSVTAGNGLLPVADKVVNRMECSLDETPNPSFKINQVGYSAAAGIKLAYLSSYLGEGDPVDLSRFTSFEIREAKTRRVVFTGSIQPHVERDIQGLDKLYILDLSGFEQEGRFHIWVDGLGRSYDFLNGQAAAERMYAVSHAGLLFQRSGFEIKEPYGGRWARPMSHDKIYVTRANMTHPSMSKGPVNPEDPASPYHVPQGPLEIHGGHYDAGDFDLRPMHINIPELLMSLYEARPRAFRDGQTDIPEKGNGIPDILDDAAWNLMSLEYIQDYATRIRGLDGGVAPGMETYAHPAFKEGKGRDLHPYFMRKVTPYFSFGAAAAFAQAARIFQPFDAVRAKRYLNRAERAYAFALSHTNEPQPTYSVGGEKPDQGEGWDARQLDSARCWAAGQLFAATRDPRHLETFKQLSPHAVPVFAGAISRWGVLWGFLGTDACNEDPALCERLRNLLVAEADKGLQAVEENGRNGYRASTIKGGGWGATSCVVRNIESVTRAYLLTREQKYLDAIAVSVDFSLGMNPSEMSWMTGAGTDYPMNPLNANCISDGVEEPTPGILIYGPSNYYKDNKCVLYPDKEGMGFYRRVVDLHGFPASCEYSVWETQAPFLFAVGVLLPDGKTRQDGP